MDTVRYETDGGVATLTLNRPDAMNALDVATKEALFHALRRASDDHTVRAVVLTGAGRAFCVGQDLREHADALAKGSRVGETVRRHYNPVVRTLTALHKPVIAAVNGVAAGAGASLAFACDLRVAAESASFTMAFSGIGLGPDSGASWTLPRLVGYGRAMELLLASERVPAAVALEMGLVNRLLPDDGFADGVREYAARLAQGAPAAYAAVKESLEFSSTHSLDDALETEARLQDKAGATEDHRNATQAFLDKKRPTFTGE